MGHAIISQAAIEAAKSATDAHGVGNEPPAHVAYDFIIGLWTDMEDSRAHYLPQEMPPLFETAYNQILGKVGQ